jgi:hypothetical protein
VLTLLKKLNLQGRILSNCEPGRISELLATPINWASVEKKLNVLQKEADVFLTTALNQSKSVSGF